MKVFVFSLFLFFTFSFQGYSSNQMANKAENKEAYTSIHSDEIELTLDLGDLTNKSQEEINQSISNLISKNLKSVDAELQCTVTVKGSINVEVDPVKISVEVSGPCSEIKEKGTEIANMILDEVKKAIE